MARMSSLLTFNIRKSQYSTSLSASGVANRWNKSKEYVIYSGSSRALAALELVAHRSAIQVDLDYKMMVIQSKVTENDITTIALSALPANWKSLGYYSKLQSIGSEWYQSRKSLILRVPSVLIPEEFNYIIHTEHPDFKKKVKIKEVEDFMWDNRLIS